MSKYALKAHLKYASLALLALMFSACAAIHPVDNKESAASPIATKTAAPAAPVAPAATVVPPKPGGTVLNDQRVIVPSEGVTKDGLLVSYSIKAEPREARYILRVSLVFRNLKQESIKVIPKIALYDASGKKLAVYSKYGFLHWANRMRLQALRDNKKTKSKESAETLHVAKENVDWAHSIWLKSEFKIPPGGIAIGGVAFGHEDIKTPMKLKIIAHGSEFEFSVEDPIQTVGK